MGRTVPSFRMVIAQEKAERKPFREGLDKKEKKEFDEMWGISKLYVSACSNSVQLVPLQPIIISILFHHYKELKECISEVEQMIEASSRAIDDSYSSKKIDWLMIREEQEQELKEEMLPLTTLDEYVLL